MNLYSGHDEDQAADVCSMVIIGVVVGLRATPVRQAPSTPAFPHAPFSLAMRRRSGASDLSPVVRGVHGAGRVRRR
jgi:hypothetical protein